jgi:hypothetical protein
MVGIVKTEMERAWKKAVLIQLMLYPGICPERQRKSGGGQSQYLAKIQIRQPEVQVRTTAISANLISQRSYRDDKNWHRTNKYRQLATIDYTTVQAGTHQLLAYADDVNLLGDNIDTTKKNTKSMELSTTREKHRNFNSC